MEDWGTETAFDIKHKLIGELRTNANGGNDPCTMRGFLRYIPVIGRVKGFSGRKVGCACLGKLAVMVCATASEHLQHTSLITIMQRKNRGNLTN